MRRDSIWKSSVFRIILSSFYGLAWMAGGAALLTILLLFMSIPERFLILSADILWCFGTFQAGRLAGKHARLHGIRTGFLCSALMCGILLAVCIGMDAELSARVGLRSAMLLPAGICGGICGVNTKIKKPPY
ncbi:MAG: TIGR04086 family membrane protein [Ruminococcus sp.]|nr:TIGR04086 family membrane protein [Ruminococcus sp.]